MRMKQIGFALIAALLALGFTVPVAAKDWDFNWNKRGVRGSGDLTTKTITVDAFTKIESNGAFDILVKVGGSQSVTITFDDNLIDFIETDVRRNTLILDSKESFSSHNNCKVEITVASLEEIYIEGSGDVQVTNLSGDLFLYEVAGSGDFKAEGTVKDIEIVISGSGDVDTRDLKAQTARVEINGSGDVMIFATESIDGEINGSGDIRYYGKPASRNVRVAGSGSMSEGR